MDRLRGIVVNRVVVILGALLLAMMTFGLSSPAWAKDGDSDKNYYKDSPEAHRRFSIRWSFLTAPSTFEGYTEDSLRTQFAEHAEVLTQYRFDQVARKRSTRPCLQKLPISMN